MKFVQEHCSICDQGVAMPVVQEDEGRAGLIWVQCPVCKEIKPIDVAAANGRIKGNDSTPGGADPEEVNAMESAARRVVRHYRAGELFHTGEWIYHSEWDDTGEVIETLRSKGGHDMMVVAFQKIGTKRLVINFAR